MSHSFCKAELFRFFGISEQIAGHKEKIISAVGAFLGILFIFLISVQFLDPETAVYIIPSMGATAVLLFAAPHGPFAQPWSVIGGHFISAIIGVSCVVLIPNIIVASAASVGLSVAGMYYCRCIHPPGGATALAAVIGSAKLHSLAYFYILAPVLLNTLCLVAVAVLFNVFFPWRRYPAHLSNLMSAKVRVLESGYEPIRHEDFVYALSQIDTFVDVTEDDLIRIYSLATGKKQEPAVSD